MDLRLAKVAAAWMLLASFTKVTPCAEGRRVERVVTRQFGSFWHERAIPSQAPGCPLIGVHLPSGDRQPDGEN